MYGPRKMPRRIADELIYMVAAMVRAEEIVSTLHKPNYSLHLAAFNVRKFNQIGQKAALARIPDTF